MRSCRLQILELRCITGHARFHVVKCADDEGLLVVGCSGEGRAPTRRRSWRRRSFATPCASQLIVPFTPTNAAKWQIRCLLCQRMSGPGWRIILTIRYRRLQISKVLSRCFLRCGPSMSSSGSRYERAPRMHDIVNSIYFPANQCYIASRSTGSSLQCHTNLQ